MSQARLEGTDQLLRGTVLAAPAPPGAWTLIALGGYGRGELSPFSDLDVQFLIEGDPADFAPFVEHCLHRWWDEQLKLGYATRNVQQTVALAIEDFKTATSLLEFRVIAGDEALAGDLSRQLWERAYEPRRASLLQQIVDERASRHVRSGDTVFLLEPDIKAGEGGLRDLHGARWASILTRGTPRLVGLGLTPPEIDALAASYQTLLQFREALHNASGRRGDRLHFSVQSAVVESLLGPGTDVPFGMQQYWQAARLVRALSRRVLDACTVLLSMPIGERIEGQGPLTPADAMAAFRLSAARDVALHPHLLGAAALTVDGVDDEARCHPGIAQDLLFLLRYPHDRARPLEHLHDVGLLSALIPEWAPLTGRYQHNVFHVYTVDVHTLHGIRELKRLAAGQGAAHPVEVMLDLKTSERNVLFLALMLHDMGKGGVDPAQARDVAARLGLPPLDCDRVGFLVVEHLLLALLAQTRDIHDEVTQRHLAREVGDRRTLAMLYLLTWADMSSANPDLLTAWKANLLRELFLRTDDLLAGGLDVFADAEKVVSEKRRKMLQRMLGSVPEHPTARTREVDAFLSLLPTRYCHVTSSKQAIIHVELCRSLAGNEMSGVALRLRHASADTAVITVCCADVPGQLTRISGVLAAHGLNIFGAEAFSRGDGVVIDDFRVEEPVPWEAVRADLKSVLTGTVDVEELLRAFERPSGLGERPAPPVETLVAADNDASQHYTVVDVRARDRPGLLYRVSRSLYTQGLTIGLARIAAEGDTAWDAFYVRSVDTGKLPDSDLRLVVAAVEASLSQSL
ncbi:MAG: [protein-PII] uridylyltransferase [Myxococcota bacterium]|jgi:[protein-PII] uridylyltransferase